MTEYQYMDDGNSEAMDLLATSFLLAQTSTGLAATGVLAGLGVTQTGTASGSVLVAAGAAVVQDSVLAGARLLVNNTVKTLDVFTANPIGALPRRDIVVFDSVTKQVAVIVGTPNASPTDPTVPATACALARLSHAGSATTTAIPTSAIASLIKLTSLAQRPVQGPAGTGFSPGAVAPGVVATVLGPSSITVGTPSNVRFRFDFNVAATSAAAFAADVVLRIGGLVATSRSISNAGTLTPVSAGFEYEAFLAAGTYSWVVELSNYGGSVADATAGGAGNFSVRW